MDERALERALWQLGDRAADPSIEEVEAVARLFDGVADARETELAMAHLGANPDTAELFQRAGFRPEARSDADTATVTPLAPRQSGARRRWSAALAVAATLVAVAGAFWIGRTTVSSGSGAEPAARMMGPGFNATPETRYDTLHVHVLRRDRIVPMSSEAGPRLRPNDGLRFSTSTREPGYLVLLSVSADGSVDVLPGPRGDQHLGLVAGREVPLPVDAAATVGGEEDWIVALFFANTPDAQQARESVRNGWSTERDPPLSVDDVPGVRSIQAIPFFK